MIKDLVLQLGIVDATLSLVWQIKLTHITRGRSSAPRFPGRWGQAAGWQAGTGGRAQGEEDSQS